MQVRLLGPVSAVVSSGVVAVSGPQMRGLLAVLALQPGSRVSDAQLMSAVWGDDAPPASSLQVAVSKLRRFLADLGEPDRVLRVPSGYQLVVPRDAVDAPCFQGLLDEARASRPEWSRTVGVLERALELWGGEPLGGVPETPALAAERTRLEELHRIAVEDLAEATLGLGDHVRVVPELEALVVAEPLRERRWALLLRALYGSGRQGDALAAYNRARTVLVEEVGAEPGPELRQLYDEVLAQDASLMDVGGAPAGSVGEVFRRRGNARHPVDRLIGRTEELRAVAGLLDDCRLVTIVGPGGVGKTRLALEVCAVRRDLVRDGVWWVDLAAARTGEDAMRSLQRVLDVGDAAADGPAAFDAICSALGDQSVLLALDNCEHLLDDLAPTVSELLARCAGVGVLATSREALRVGGEAVFPLSPLGTAAAAELFQARVAVPIDGDAVASGVVEDICLKLDCLPLALELAAARAQHLRLDELLDRLADRFDLLPMGRRDAPERQRNLEAIADWSYGLLEEAEQVVFERLSVFSDGTTMDAARAVCSTPAMNGAAVEGVVHRLVDKSLVVADRSAPVTRYRMLQTLADFAAARLEARGGVDAAHHAHARWVRRLAATTGWRARITGADVAAIHDEDAAVRDAVGWAVANDPVLAVEICEDLSPYWFGAMRVSTGWELLHSALDALGDRDPARRSSALAWALVFATLVQDVDLADELAAEAWQFEQRLGNPERLGRLSLHRALAAGYRADGDLTYWVGVARDHLTGAGSEIGLGHLHFAEGAGLIVVGDLEPAAARLSEAIEAFRRAEDHLGMILAVSRLGELAWRLDDLDLFAEMHLQLLELGEASRTQSIVIGATARLALAKLHQGEVDAAQQMARSALAGSGDTFMPVINGYAFRTAGLVDLHAGHVAAGHAELATAIQAFERGAGSVGVGQAALCWIDLSRSHLARGDLDAAHSAAEAAEALAHATADPWVCQQAAANTQVVTESST